MTAAEAPSSGRPGAEDAVRVRVLIPGDEPEVERLLAAHADASLFLRRNLAGTGVVDHEARYHGTWAGAFEGGRLTGVAQHTRFGTVLVQAPAHAGAVACAAVAASGRPVSGFVGPWAQVLAARAALGFADAPMRVESREGLYALALDALVVPEPLGSDRWRCRRARGDDLDLLVRWRVAYNVEANHETEDDDLRAKGREEIEAGLAERAGWVLEADGVPVAYQQFNAMLPDVVQVGGVWTPPALRGRGYARAVVAGSLLAARAEGVGRAVLFTGDDNAPARRAYAALGFTRIGDWGLLFLATPARPRTR
jgi:RimJ/RimL family protein N-acetyltransferase